MRKFVFLTALAAVLTTGLMADKCTFTNVPAQKQDQPADQSKPADQKAQ